MLLKFLTFTMNTDSPFCQRDTCKNWLQQRYGVLQECTSSIRILTGARTVLLSYTLQ